MSISIKHPSGTVTSSTALSFVVQGGSPTNPKNISFSASSVIMPNVVLPNGVSGAIIFDSTSKTMKYFDGFNWIEWVAASTISGPLQTQIDNINSQLATKVDKVIYSSSAVPTASISGTTLYINFPTSASGTPNTTPGLFTTLPTGAITHYSLTSGQTIDSIREQMSGNTGGQSGRTGTQSNPYVTSTGWCLADGMYWSWAGASGTVLRQTPNLNQAAYLKGISANGVTKTDTVIGASGTVDNATITTAPHYHGTGAFLSTSGSSADDVALINASWPSDGSTYNTLATFGNQNGRRTDTIGSGSTDTGTRTSLNTDNGNTTVHNHTLSNLDVSHFNTAILYNIATPALALNQATADTRYVLKAGDTMTGALNVANNLTVRSDSANLVFWFNTSGGTERAVIYHSNTSNTLRLRSNGGNEIYLDNSGRLTAVNMTTGSLTATSAINAAGNVSGGSLSTTGNINASGTVTSAGFGTGGNVSTGTLNVSGSANTGVLNVNGQITATGDIWAFSDLRLKENLRPIDNALEKLSALSGVIGNMIGEDKERSMVIAQEVQKVLPEAVETDENGYLKVNYSGLIPLLIQSINELASIVKGE